MLRLQLGEAEVGGQDQNSARLEVHSTRSTAASYDAPHPYDTAPQLPVPVMDETSWQVKPCPHPHSGLQSAPIPGRSVGPGQPARRPSLRAYCHRCCHRSACKSKPSSARHTVRDAAPWCQRACHYPGGPSKFINSISHAPHDIQIPPCIASAAANPLGRHQTLPEAAPVSYVPWGK